MSAPDVFIKGLGVHLPGRVTIESAVAQGHYPAADVELHQLTGATVAGDLPAPDMALRAARQAFARARHDPRDIDLLLYAASWHQGPDGWQPHCHLQRNLVGGDMLAVEVRQGCNGMFAALALGAAHLRSTVCSDPADGPASALLVAADNFGTPMIDRWRMGPGYVAGDAGSAVLLTTEPSFARLCAVRSVTVAEAEQMHRGDEPMFPPGPTVGRALDFATRGVAYKRAAVAAGEGTGALIRIHQQTLAVVASTLAAAGLDLGDVTRVAYMNYSREIVEQRCMAALGLAMSRSTWEFGRTVGHLGASDQVVSLDHLVSAGELRPGDHLLMLGVGPGVTISCALVEIVEPVPWRD
ncbi:ketoacyl-ACP synthase III family protein [Frankia sp. AgKG'84/4]|uniref:ketoacyl-ACP synthase III family protein n=1 Tax=Frankia sp. AgKG'84/4 TaxID=573490 RepID=UPI00200BC05A|nr:ketoacyl-ACP synthase III family protein [Frankia sp. AgKG'84/4]MCL9792807.1 ketoacyl-ACP synthase III family protein [Frankia sp. AgKG'84/4]